MNKITPRNLRWLRQIRFAHYLDFIEVIKEGNLMDTLVTQYVQRNLRWLRSPSRI